MIFYCKCAPVPVSLAGLFFSKMPCRSRVSGLLFTLFMLIAPTTLYAQCNALPGTTNQIFSTTGPSSFLFNTSNLYPDGTPLSPWYVSNFPTFFQCQADSSGTYYYSYYGATAFNTYTQQNYLEAGYYWTLRYTYGSNNTGLGFAMGVSSDASKFVEIPFKALGSGYDYIQGITGGSAYLKAGDILRVPVYFSYRLFRTGQLRSKPIASGTYNFTYAAGDSTATIALSVSGGGSSYPTVLWNKVLIAPQTVTINDKTCTVLTSALLVQLPTINVNTLSTVGSVSTPTSFSLPVTCTNSTNVYMTFTDGANPGQTTSILQPSSSSTSSGVGLQLKGSGNKLIYFGPDSNVPGTTNQFLAAGNVVGLTNLPFTASYIRTGAVAPGSFNALATFTMSYQ